MPVHGGQYSGYVIQIHDNSAIAETNIIKNEMSSHLLNRGNVQF